MQEARPRRRSRHQWFSSTNYLHTYKEVCVCRKLVYQTERCVPGGMEAKGRLPICSLVRAPLQVCVCVCVCEREREREREREFVHLCVCVCVCVCVWCPCRGTARQKPSFAKRPCRWQRQPLQYQAFNSQSKSPRAIGWGTGVRMSVPTAVSRCACECQSVIQQTCSREDLGSREGNAWHSGGYVTHW